MTNRIKDNNRIMNNFKNSKARKKAAFTLAEVMILLLTLSILLAAFAPVFTRRYSSGGIDDVWSYVPADNSGDAYFDDTDKSHSAQAFIGLTPFSEQDVKEMSGAGEGASTIQYPAKLIIGADNNQPHHSNRRQNHIQFRYNNQELGGLLATTGESILVGGRYNSVNISSAQRNTSFGLNSLSALTTGQDNTAVGFNSLSNVTTGSANTVIGSNAGTGIKLGYGNTIVGYNTGNGLTDSDANYYNTFVGYNIGIKGYQNTIVGNNTATVSGGTAYNNTFVGNNIAANLKSGYGNTVVGYNSLNGVSSAKTYKFNTIIGANAGNGITNSNAAYKTCIGSGSCNVGYSSFLTDDKERVFIGRHPESQTSGSGSNSPIATLEVHNVEGNVNYSAPLMKVGNPTVLINGNLIVRGQTYLEIPILRSYVLERNNNTYATSDGILRLDKIPKGLVLHTLKDSKYFAGDDGRAYTGRSYERCRKSDDYGWFHNRVRKHQFKDVHENCICTSNALHTAYKHPYYDVKSGSNYTSYSGYPSMSYDWVSAYNRMSGGSNNTNGISSTGDADSYANLGGTGDQPGSDFGYNNGAIWNRTGKPDPHVNHVSGFAWYGMWSEAYPYATSGAYYNVRKKYARSWYIDQTRPVDNYNSQKIIFQRNTGKGAGVFHRPSGDEVTDEFAVTINGEDLGDMFNLGTDYNYAHQHSYQSCCPNLTGYTEDHLYPGNVVPSYGVGPAISGQVFGTSDARLKNIGDKFTAGLDEIKKLNIYNYTFKADFNKLPQVGVIAQDLRLIFPKAVTKDENGYLKIRWDEMFYAAINAIKTLNTRVNDLAAKVDNYNKRVQQLKADNKQLNAQLDKLTVEVEKMQSKK